MFFFLILSNRVTVFDSQLVYFVFLSHRREALGRRNRYEGNGESGAYHRDGRSLVGPSRTQAHWLRNQQTRY